MSLSTAGDNLTEFDSADFVGATGSGSIDVAKFDAAYAARPPWDIDGPQPAFAHLLDVGQITGRVLDIGCGTGENALHYASRGLDVTAVDASATAIRRAREKARERNSTARFLHADALAITELGETFDTVTDSGFLHVLSDQQIAQLVEAVHAVLRPGGVYLLACFSEHATGNGPRKLSRARITTLFTAGWRIHSIEATAFETVPDRGFDAHRAAAWLAVVERI